MGLCGRHELMLLCWSFEPERRPTFKYCLETLNILHDKISKNPVTGAHNGQYISTVPERKLIFLSVLSCFNANLLSWHVIVLLISVLSLCIVIFTEFDGFSNQIYFQDLNHNHSGNAIRLNHPSFPHITHAQHESQFK